MEKLYLSITNYFLEDALDQSLFIFDILKFNNNSNISKLKNSRNFKLIIL